MKTLFNVVKVIVGLILLSPFWIALALLIGLPLIA